MATVERLRPDVVVMSFRWSGQDAGAFCRQIMARVPTTRVLIMSYQDGDEEMLTSVLAGASGYLSKDAREPELVRAIMTVAAGGGCFDGSTVRRVIARFQGSVDDETAGAAPSALSEREVAILRMVGEGLGNREIGQRLNIATTTVRNNITRIRDKLDLTSRSGMRAFAIQHGLVDVPEHEWPWRAG